MELVVSAIVALIVVGFIGYPLLREQVSDDEPETPLSEEAEELYRRKESTYSALKELEFDYKTGKLSESDYRELEERYRTEAIEVLEAIDLLEKEGPARDTKAAKRKAAAAAAVVAVDPLAAPDDEETVEAPSRSRRRRSKSTSAPAAVGACPECSSTRNPADARFCGSCGASLVVAGEPTGTNGNGAPGEPDDMSSCDECGAELKADNRFCGACGAEVHARS